MLIFTHVRVCVIRISSFVHAYPSILDVYLTPPPTYPQIELRHLGMASPVHPHVQPPARSASEIHYLCVIEEDDFHGVRKQRI